MKKNKSHQNNLPRDYQPLYQYLSRKDWLNADLATRELMLKIAQVQRRKDLNPLVDDGVLLTKSDLEKFPCIDLQRINQLWYQASQGKFSFQVTYQLYQNNDYNYANLANLVGWKQGENWIKFEQIIFSLDAPQGHLPLAWLVPKTFSMYWCARFASAGWSLMFNRWQHCQTISIV